MAGSQLVLEAACAALDARFHTGAAEPPVQADHAGTGVLIRLSADAGPAGAAAAHRALTGWLGIMRDGLLAAGRDGRRPRGLCVGAGLCAGTAGLLAGLLQTAGLDPGLSPVLAAVRRSLGALGQRSPWRAQQVTWPDYDLVAGPAGIVLALAADPSCPAELVLPAARHLALLCDRTDLERLRIGDPADHRIPVWNSGRINTGLAHGVGGVVAGLRAACEVTGTPAELAGSLRRASTWLLGEAFVGERELVTWPRSGWEGASPAPRAARRQAWCYGTPGLAWTLWEAGRVLGDAGLQRFAEGAMSSFCRAFDADLHIYDGRIPGEALTICHGAAGLLAIADAFARHAGMSDAAALADRLEDYLLARIGQVPGLAAGSLDLLAGAAGVLAMLLTRQGGDRGWLTLVALR